MTSTLFAGLSALDLGLEPAEGAWEALGDEDLLPLDDGEVSALLAVLDPFQAAGQARQTEVRT